MVTICDYFLSYLLTFNSISLIYSQPFIFIFEVRVAPSCAIARSYRGFFSSIIRLFSPNLPRLFTSLTEITRCHPSFLSVYLIEKNRNCRLNFSKRVRATKNAYISGRAVLSTCAVVHTIVTACSNRCPTLLLWWRSSKNIYFAELPRKLGFFYWFRYWNI